MSASIALQYVLVALAVTASAWAVLAKQFPGVVRSLRGALALPLLREGRPQWLRPLGRLLAPPATTGGGTCGGCDGCGPVKTKR
ncbi:DUF6587 family protein [Luteimonas sp. R10]|uniref:DUF6587 family protein n=1 Tax=Luteimonas sp. R10 TaxID=3108176 RepID=UPI00308D0932|nr:DUF6587 family protein [Luteimonas sp. R10]